jgi:hypothetical protein
MILHWRAANNKQKTPRARHDRPRHRATHEPDELAAIVSMTMLLVGVPLR